MIIKNKTKMEKLFFKNKAGKEIKTTMPDDIMNKVADVTESELCLNRISYSRKGTVFFVQQNDINKLINAQAEATKKLINDGVIKKHMVEKDLEEWFNL